MTEPWAFSFHFRISSGCDSNWLDTNTYQSGPKTLVFNISCDDPLGITVFEANKRLWKMKHLGMRMKQSPGYMQDALSRTLRDIIDNGTIPCPYIDDIKAGANAIEL